MSVTSSHSALPRFALADILAPRVKPEASGGRDVRALARAAYLEATGGRFGELVLLSDLRTKLPDTDRAALDDALSEMHLGGEATLSGLDNPREITASVRDAAVEFKGLRMHQFRIAR